MKLRIGVIFGGASVEHEVSVISALQAIQNMDNAKYEVVPIYISKDRLWYCGNEFGMIENYRNVDTLLKKSSPVMLTCLDGEFCLFSTKGLFHKIIDKIDVAFPIVHGQNVEDGSLVGFLETIGIPYVGSGVLGSCLGQDKVVMKQVFASSNIPVVPYVWFFENDYYERKESILKDIQEMGYPVVVKPARLGSSVGIHFAKEESELLKYIEEAFTYDRKIVVEKAISDLIEVNCSVLGTVHCMEVSEIEQVFSDHDILTFQDKYVGNGKTKGSSKGMVNASRVIPADISDDLSNQVQNLSKQVFSTLNFSGVVRIDFLIDANTNEVYVNEPNVIPGSLAFYLWEPKGVSYSKLLDEMITFGIKEYKERNQKITCFDTNILENFGGLKGSKGKLNGK